MARRHYLITYDIADDKRRSRVFDLLGDNGNHTQYSVFLCQLNEREAAGVRAALAETIHAREDQVLLVDLGPVTDGQEPGIEALGRAYAPPVRTMII